MENCYLITLKTKTEIRPFQLSDDVCSSFTEKFVLYTKPKDSFLMTYWIVDFEKKELNIVRTDLQENLDYIKKVNPNMLNIQTHAACSINGNGFYCLPLIGGHCNYFYYVDLKNDSFTIYSGRDLNHANSDVWKDVSSTFQINTDSDKMLMGFTRKDSHIVDIVRMDEELNCDTIFTLENQTNAPHEIVEYKDYIITTHFNTFKGTNLKTSKRYNCFQDVVDDKVDLENGIPDFIEIDPGEINFYNLKTKEKTKELVDCPPTAHLVIKDDELFLSQHNLLAAYKFYTFTGPAKISKWQLNDGWKYVSSFQDNEVFRCSSHIAFDLNNKSYLATMGYPNRLVIIDTATMTIDFKYDFIKNILSTEDPNALVNGLIKNPQLDYYHSNDINISQNGKFVIYTENNKIGFFNLETKENCSEFIPFENENVTGKKPIMHTKFLRR